MLRAQRCVLVFVCVHWCTHDRIRISAIAIGKSSEPFITLIPTLILNVGTNCDQALRRKRTHCLCHRCKKFMNKAHLHATSQTIRKLSSRQPRTRFVSTDLFFTFSPIESYYETISAIIVVFRYKLSVLKNLYTTQHNTQHPQHNVNYTFSILAEHIRIGLLL